MKRKIYNELLKWKEEEKGRVAILIDGARRVGKSYIVKEFAKNEYKSFIFIDFNSAPKDIFALFDNYLSNLDSLFMYLQNMTGVKLFERESLIVFDEVQLCPRARAAIKYLVEDGRYDYIETGSLVSINKNVKDIVAKSLGSNTQVNVAKATLNALVSQRTKEHIAELRGKKVEEL